jgi:hypothetical protein
MTRWMIGGVLLLAAVFAASFLRPPEPASAAPPEERNFEPDGAVRVVRKGSSESYFLSRPRSVRVADRGFLYGWKVDGDSAVYIPVSEIELIEEFSSVERMKKVYRVGPPPNVIEKTTEKK